MKPLKFTEGCKSPVLEENVLLDYPCPCDFGGVCQAKCAETFILNGPNTIQCLNDGSWSKQPTCSPVKCSSPNLPSALQINGSCSFVEQVPCKVECVRKDFILDGPDTIVCQNQVWSEFPKCKPYCIMHKIPTELDISGHCSGDVGENCVVACKNKDLTLHGESIVTCQATGEWSEFPVCGCSSDTVPSYVVLGPGCKMKSGEPCPANCDSNYVHQGVSEIFCGENGLWDMSKSLVCLIICAEITVPDNMVYEKSNCKVQGEECVLKCKSSRQKMTGSDTIKCLPTGKYSQIPACVDDGHCSHPDNLNHIIFIGDCGYSQGEVCHIACSDPSLTMVGPNYVTCEPSGAWSEFPKCVKMCDKPMLTNNLNINNNSANCLFEANYKCDVYCDDGYAIEGPKEITCTEDGSWSSMPRCILQCPVLEISSQVILFSNCTRLVNEECIILCHEADYEAVPTNKILCQPGGEWTRIPKCVRKCEELQLPDDLDFSGVCDNRIAGKICFVKCKDDDYIMVGEPQVECEDSGKWKWLQQPSCVKPCSVPNFPGYKIVGDCRPKVNPTCNLACENPLATMNGEKQQAITCTQSTWEKIPECEVVCDAPELLLGTHIVGTCDRADNSECRVTCNDPLETMDGEKEYKIKCLNTIWTTAPVCVKLCDEPVLPDELVLAETCLRKKTVPCRVKCKDSVAIMSGSPTFFCDESGKWTELPTCVKKCDAPYLPRGLEFVSPCERLVDQSCTMKCRPPQRMHGNPDITCLENLSWSTIPTCRLETRCPALPHYLKFVSECNRRPRTTCQVTCVDESLAPSSESVTCEFTLQWASVPTCAKKIVKCIPLPEYIEFENDCVAAIGTTCKVKCAGGRFVNGRPYAYCEPTQVWSGLPLCTMKPNGGPMNVCPMPSQVPNLAIKTCAVNVLYSCVMECANRFFMIGKPQTTCQPNGKWTTLPYCAILCLLSDLERAGLQRVTAACYWHAGEYCSVTCVRPTDSLVNAAASQCTPSGTWSMIPRCAPSTYRRPCNAPLPPDLVMTTTECTNGGRGQCILKCRNATYYKIVGPGSIVCLDRGWSEIPKCEINYSRYYWCGVPKLPSNQKFTSPCEYLDEGSECSIQCVQNPSVRGRIVCLNSGQWWGFLTC